ncbi:MAG: hypothetical protein HQL43_02655 [Alphaproteobacteria bacterium]|nr:hypothetical protein [Alphaproteobacteria bacterium]
MVTRPPISLVVQSLSEAVAALLCARDEGRRVVLESPPRAGEIQGAAWFLALAEEAMRLVPGVKAEVLIDAGEAPALALDALARGATAVRVKAPLKVRAKLQAIAHDCGGRIETQGKKQR